MINYFSSTDYVVNNKDELTLWLETAIIKEGRTLGELVFNFCSDETLLKINKEFLNHDTLTDVITFDYCVNNEVSGEVFISAERVRENANEYQQSFDQEKRRVMIHGVLHLCGYKDKTDKDRALMSEMESFYLDSFS